MTTQTIQLTIPSKYQSIFDMASLSKTIISLEDFLGRLGFDKEIIQEITYVKQMKKDIQTKNHTSSHKL